MNRARQVAAAAAIRSRMINAMAGQSGDLFDAMSRACGLADRRMAELIRGRCP